MDTNAPSKKPAAKKTSRGRSTQPAADAGVEKDGDLDDFLLPLPSGAMPGGKVGDAVGVEEMDGLPQTNRRSVELQAQMLAQSAGGKPVFPYPAELPEAHRVYWLELVNSFPADHFQKSDITLMKLYCRCASDIERTTLLIEDEGEVVMGGRGPMVNPRVKVRGDATNTLMSIATKFRNQPASRVNSENFGDRQKKAQTAAGAARTVAGDGDDLLAGGNHARH